MDRKLLLATTLGIGLLAPSSSEAGTTRRVNMAEESTCGSSCDGSAWTEDKVYTNLQDALADAEAGDEIWIATGSYYPHDCSGGCDRDATFDVCGATGLRLYGGFVGTETDKSQRVFQCYDGSTFGAVCTLNSDCASDSVCIPANETILSGDIDLDDDAGACSTDEDCGTGNYCVGSQCIKGDNSYHVVSCGDLTGEPILDGLVIEHGRADGGASPPNNQGAAVQIRATDLCLAGTMKVHNCLVRNNYSSNHGAINDHSSASEFANCFFQGNESVKGAALLVDNGSPTISDSVFDGNSVAFRESSTEPSRGGAVWFGSRAGEAGCPVSDPDPVIANSMFKNNYAGSLDNLHGSGGAVWVEGRASLQITASDFHNNHAKVEFGLGGGGAIYATDSEFVTLNLNDCSFADNSASPGVGGAVYSFSGVDVTRCTFESNTATVGAGAVYVLTSAGSSYESCTFSNNTTTGIYGGGAMRLVQTAEPADVVNCQFTGNLSTALGPDAGRGGALAISGPMNIVNCSFADNRAEGDMSTTDDGRGGAVFIEAICDKGNQACLNNGVCDKTLPGCSVIMSNCILWANTDTHDPSPEYQQVFAGCRCSGQFDDGVYVLVDSSCDELRNPECLDNNPTEEFMDENVSYSIWEGYSGTAPGMKNANPEFASEFSDLRIACPTSPAINAGDDSAIAGYSTDLDGNNRISGSAVDIGAYEWSCEAAGDCLACGNDCIVSQCTLDGVCLSFGFEPNMTACNAGEGVCCDGACCVCDDCIVPQCQVDGSCLCVESAPDMTTCNAGEGVCCDGACKGDGNCCENTDCPGICCKSQGYKCMFSFGCPGG